MASYNEKAKELINSLYKLTLDKKIEWISLSRYVIDHDNQSLKRYIEENNSCLFSPNQLQYINEYKSVCAELLGGVIYIFAYRQNDPQIEYICALQKQIQEDVYNINNKNTYQYECKQIIDTAKELEKADSIDKYWSQIIDLAHEKK